MNMSWKNLKPLHSLLSISKLHSVSTVILTMNLKQIAPVRGSKERVKSWKLVSSKPG